MILTIICLILHNFHFFGVVVDIVVLVKMAAMLPKISKICHCVAYKYEQMQKCDEPT